jgi:hypothetical protein
MTGQPSRVGLPTHWVLTKGFRLIPPSFPGFAWRTKSLLQKCILVLRVLRLGERGYEHRLRAGVDARLGPGSANACPQKGGLQENLPREGLRRQLGADGVSADARSAPPRRHGHRVETRPPSEPARMN